MLTTRSGAFTLGVGILIGSGIALTASWLFWRYEAGWTVFDTPYQAVLLTNGQAYYGKLKNLGSSYPTLTDVHYVKQQDAQAGQAGQFVLVKRGQEWHRPDRMILNANQIAFIEPVLPDSRVGKLIAESK